MKEGQHAGEKRKRYLKRVHRRRLEKKHQHRRGRGRRAEWRRKDTTLRALRRMIARFDSHLQKIIMQRVGLKGT